MEPDFEALLKSAATDFLRHAGDEGPFQQAVYAAMACGGGEVGLYTLLGGLFRAGFTGEAESFRLAINMALPDSIASCMRPDFQVHPKDQFKRPCFASEFKLLYQSGQWNSRPQEVLSRIQGDVNRLATIADKGLQTAMIVFVHTEGTEPCGEIDESLERKGFARLGIVPLWEPLGMSHSAHLHLWLSTGNDISKFGERLSSNTKAG
jgi:hypothetical protein